MSELTYKRGIADVTRDIRIKTGQFLMDAIEIGRLLFEAKSMVEPGSWGKYVEEELPFSHSWANNYMRLYKELGGEQLSLFGNSQALMNLQPTKALELLVLPAEEREEFMETHDVESMSSRELHQAIKDLEEEKAARKAADERAARLKQARENPKIPDAVMEQMRKEAEVAAAKQAREELQKQMKATEEKLQAAQTAAADAEAKLAAAQKEVKLSNPNVVIFKTIMGQIQDDFNRMNGVLLKTQQEDPAVADNLKQAFLKLLDKLKEAI